MGRVESLVALPKTNGVEVLKIPMCKQGQMKLSDKGWQLLQTALGDYLNELICTY